MISDTLQPKGLVKLLVGQELVVSVEMNRAHQYEVEVYTTAPGDQTVVTALHQGLTHTARIMMRRSGFYTWNLRFRKTGTKTWHWLKDGQNRKVSGEIQVDPSWLAQAIVYCVFVRFFKGKTQIEPVQRSPASLGVSDQSIDDLKQKQVHHKALVKPGEGGTFDDVKAYLDTLQSMQVNVLYFNPIHTIGELYRGYNLLDQLPGYLQPGSPYSIKDYKAIDPELAYDKDKKTHLLSDPQQEFKDLIQAAHERGMFIIMDLVFNHTAHDFVFQRIRPEWYVYKDHINSLTDPYLYPDDIHLGKPWGDPRHSLAPYDHGVWWEDCAQLNWEYKMPQAPNLPPPNYSLNEMWEYFKAIPSYWVTRFGIDGFRCDVAYRVPPAFWKACISETRKTAQRVKTNRSHDVVFVAETYNDEVETLQAAGFSAVYGDYSHKLKSPLELKGYLDYIYNQSVTTFPQGSKWFHFPDSHDFDRTPRKVLGDQANNPEAGLLANQSRWVLTATLPGIPLLFNGFEKIEWQPINIWSYGAIDWEKEADLKTYITKVNTIRRHLPALQKGDYLYLETNQGLNEQTQLFAYLRTYGSQTVIVVVNMDVYHQAGPATIKLPPTFKGTYTLSDHLKNTHFERKGQDLIVILPPGGAHIFEVWF